MLTTRPALPIDVVRLTLEAAYLIPDHTLWDEYGRGRRVAWFASTLRVSRTWHTAGQQSLYHRIQLTTQNERSIALLIRTLSQQPQLAQMVKALHIHSLAGRERKMCTKGSFQLPMPSIPLVTQKGRRAWRRNRQYDKLARLLGLCEAMTELGLEPPDLIFVTHVLETTQTSIDRFTIRHAHEVSHDQWEGLGRSRFWRNLRSIQFLATDPNWGSFYHDEISGSDAAFTGREPFKRLERLEIVGFIPAKTLCTIIDAVRPTLKTLHCDQTEETSSIWLYPVSTKLQNLGLTVWPFTPLADLSSFTRLERLTVTLPPATRRRPKNTIVITTQSLPPSISVFELQVSAHFQPWSAASHVAQVLHAFDFGLLPNLRRIVLSASMNAPKQLCAWEPAAFLLTNTVKRRGLEFKLDVRFELQAPDLFQFDCFARARHEHDTARQLEQSKKMKSRGQPGIGASIADGFITAGAHAYFCFCCVMYTSCCCCFLAQYFE